MNAVQPSPFRYGERVKRKGSGEMGTVEGIASIERRLSPNTAKTYAEGKRMYVVWDEGCPTNADIDYWIRELDRVNPEPEFTPVFVGDSGWRA